MKTNKKTFKNKKRIFKKKKKYCFFRRNKIEDIDFKDIDTISRFVNNGKIVPSRISKVSAKYQRKLSKAIKNARSLGLLPNAGC